MPHVNVRSSGYLSEDTFCFLYCWLVVVDFNGANLADSKQGFIYFKYLKHEVTLQPLH